MSKSILLVLLLGVVLFQFAQAGPIVRTTEGRYRGTTFPNGARAYLGIPFAQPPINDLRWKPAKKAKSFKGIRDAVESGPCCPQSGIFRNVTVAESEDCLTLDVYTPKNARKGDKLQVKVYIHGGGFAANSAVLYPGDELAVQTDSVVVVINYRLSYQGFMVFTPLLAESKGVVNHGVTDQQLALKWVQKNIHNFGGDKKNVAIFGNSAGGLSVLLHYALPSSKNLFKVGLSESAGPWNLISAQTAAAFNDPLAARFGCYNATTGVNLACMRAVPWQQIYNYTWAAAQPTYDALITQPIDVTFAQKAKMNKAKAGTPVMLGYSSVEGNQFAWLALRIFTRIPRPELNASFPLFVTILNNSLPFTNEVILQVANYYSSLAENGNYYIPLREALGDYGIKCGIARTAVSALKGLDANVYNYYFSHNTADWRYTFLNATHTVDVPYLFLTNGTIAETKFTPEEKKLARRLVKYFGNFQDTEDPNEEKARNPSLPEVNNLPKWPVFKSTKASTLDWTPKLPVISLPVPAGCKQFWDTLPIDDPFNLRSSQKIYDYERFLNNPDAIHLFN